MTQAAISKTMDALKPGEHLCCLYETEEQHRAVLSSFLSQGLELGEKVIYILDERTPEEILGYLKDTGLGVEPFLEQGQVRVLTCEEAYIRNGTFDPDSMIALLERETKQSLDEGWKALRVTGEMSWALREVPGSERLIEYEAKLNRFIPRSRCIALCQYDRRRFHPQVLLDVLRTHPTAVIGTGVYQNFYYVSPEALLGWTPIEEELSRWIKNLEERKRIEEALRDSEEKYRAVVENANDAIFVVQDGIIKFVNSRALEMIDFTYEELTSRPFGEFIHPDDRDMVPERHVKRQQGVDLPSQYSFRIIAKSGDVHWVELNVVMIEWEDRPAALSFLSDITERKCAENELRNQYTAIEAVNDILKNTLRCDTDEEVARNCLEIVENLTDSEFGWLGEINESGRLDTIALSDPGWDACGIKEGSPPRMISNMEISGIWGRVLKDGVPLLTNDPVRHVASVGLPEGHPAIVSFLGVPLKSSEQTIGMVALANKPSGYTRSDKNNVEMLSTAIEEALRRKRAEERLRHSERLLSETQALSKVGGWEYDVENKKLTWTDEVYKIYGLDKTYDPNNIKQDISFYGIEDQYKIKQAFDDALTNRIPYDLELSFSSATGEKKWVRTIGDPIIEGGYVTKVIGNIMDITDRKRAEEEREKLEAQLRLSQKLESIGRLAGGVAHDFNNMLSVILGHTQLAMGKVSSDNPLHEDLSQVLTAAKRSTEITRQLLAFAREQIISPRVMDLNETVEGMLKMLRRLIGEDIDLVWKPESGLWPMMLDPAQIDQVLANLCVNARDAIEGVGKITIETGMVSLDRAYCDAHPVFVPGDYVVLAVSDNGCGMDEETRENVFEPFFTTKTQDKGTGLGLATVYGIVKQNKGFINVYSEPGRGSTFKIYLPRYQGEAEREVREEGAQVIPSGRGETVLIVEDEISVLNLSKKMLQRLGYTVLTAASPSEAISLAEDQASPIDLLITDVIMPEMSGRDLAERLNTVHPKMTVLFMSGYTANVIAHRGILDPGVRFIEKPFSISDVAAKVREAMDGK